MSATFAQKKMYEAKFGKIPKGYHIHRIIPGYLGGKYTIENMIALSIEAHVQIHKDRYEEYGDIRDYTAAKLLEERRGITAYERSSLGGKVSGQFKNSTFQSEQGKKGGKCSPGDHVDKVKFAETRKAGGSASAKKAKETNIGSIYQRIDCEYCNKNIRNVDKRWHVEGRCINKAAKK